MSRPKKEHGPISEDSARVIEYINEHGGYAQGRTELIRHLTGQRLTLKEALKANCYECNGYFSDGREDCKMPHCPLYPYMVYNPDKQRARNITDEQAEAMGKRLREAAQNDSSEG